MIFVVMMLAMAAVLAAFWLLQRHIDRQCRMSESWLEHRRREASR